MYEFVLILVATFSHSASTSDIDDLLDEVQKQAHPGIIIFDENFNAKSI